MTRIIIFLTQDNTTSSGQSEAGCDLQSTAKGNTGSMTMDGWITTWQVR